MLSLQINGQYIDLSDDFSFTMNLKNPMFNEMGSYTYPFKLPNTPRTAKLLDFRHRIENTGDVYKPGSGLFLWDSHELFAGSLKMKSLNKNFFEGSLVESSSDFYFQAKNLNLQQIDFGQKLFANDVDAILYLSSSKFGQYPEFPFACPTIQNDLYFDPPTDDFDLQYYNDWHGGGRLWTELAGGGHVKEIIVPMLYLKHVYASIAKQLGYKLMDDLFTTHPDLARLVLYNSVSCNYAISPYLPITHLQYNYHVPRMPLMDFFDAVEKFFCATTFIDGLNNTMRILPNAKVFSDPSYIDFSDNILSISTELEDQVLGHNLKMTVDPDDPKMEPITNTEPDIIKWIRGSVKTRFELPAWPLGQIMERYYVEDEQRYWWLDIDYTWKPDTITWPVTTQFFYRQPKESIESKASTLLWYWNVPCSEPPHQGCVTCGNKMSDWEKIPPRFLFAMPEMSYNGSGLFVNAENETANYSLWYPGGKGIYAKWWMEYLNFKRTTKLIKTEKVMTFTELQNFDFSRKYRINGINYLVKSIQVVLKKYSIQPALLECYTCM
jgi:hypothetical protein